MKPTQFHAATDSGAHSIFMTTIKSKKYREASLNISQRAQLKRRYDLSYINSDKFQEYFHKYCTYLKENEKRFEFYITLDVIAHHKESYDMTMRMIDEYGLKPAAVVHYGADLSWVKKYMDRCDYICISGFGKTRASVSHDPWVESIFKLISDKHGRPKWKVHGLAVSRIELMDYYPFYSVDASTPFFAAHVGELCIPTRDDPVRPGLLGYRKIPITYRRHESQRHYARMSPRQKAVVDEYAVQNGFTTKELEEKYSTREALNMILFTRIAKEIEERRGDFGPLRMYTAGAITEQEIFYDCVKRRELFERNGVKDVYYLGTFYAKNVVNWFMDKLCNGAGKDNENRRPRLRVETRPTLRHVD